MDIQRIDDLLVQMRKGEPAARDELLRLMNDRIERVSRRLLAAFPAVHRWYDTGDVRQFVLIRTVEALEAVDVKDSLHLLRLVARKIRHTILDLKKQISRSKEVGFSALAFDPVSKGAALDPVEFAVDDTHDPQRLAEWLEVHESIANLDDDDRRLFDLLWYNDLSQAAAAQLLGVCPRQVKRRWREARSRLGRKLVQPFS